MSICGWLSTSGSFEGSLDNELDRLTTAGIARGMVSISGGYLFDEYLRYTSRVAMSVTAEEFLIQNGYVRIDTDRPYAVYGSGELTDAQHDFVTERSELNVY